MRPLQYTIPAGFLLAFAAASPALAQAPNFPYVEIETTSVSAGIGGQSGDGILRLPNLGTNCTYPLKVSGFGVATTTMHWPSDGWGTPKAATSPRSWVS